ncbi:MAG: response regulator transcription factor [Dinghuibacter sp.]|nr:response regulator transcription factor [Dinghuibacter sp.]
MIEEKRTILFLEDEFTLAEIVRETLESKGFNVLHFDKMDDARNSFYKEKPDIVLLDVMLPDGDGYGFAKEIRQTDITTPVIFLTSRSLPADVVKGFESGGNDYLKKPFSIEELIVRIKALLNKHRTLNETQQPLDESVSIGKYIFSYHHSAIIYSSQRKTLTSREAELLKLMYLNKNRIIDRKTLLESIWGNDDFFTGRSLDVFITKLRKYLDKDPMVKILNIRGIGYKLIC